MSDTVVRHECGCGGAGGCGGRGGTGAPVLERLSYFFGQMLEPVDFRAEQDYFRNQLALLTRSTAGWGVACGLDLGLTPAAPGTCDDRPEIEGLLLTVSPGIAFDPAGRVIVRRRPSCDRLWPLLDDAERAVLVKGGTLHVSIEHVEVPTGPVRGIDDTGCDPFTVLEYGRFRDEARIRVSVQPPSEEECENCLPSGSGCAVPLAGIQVQGKGSAMVITTRNELRRLLGRHRLTAISALGWVHGGAYDPAMAKRLLGAGIGMRFTRPVRVATLVPGVADLVVYEGGSGRRDGWYIKAVDLAVPDPAAEFSDRVTVRVTEPEGVNPGDRIMLKLRADFVLDRCCRSVSGSHRGGLVGFDPALSSTGITHPAPVAPVCAHPPERLGPWHSGSGAEGGTFETWINVGAEPETQAAGAATTSEQS